VYLEAERFVLRWLDEFPDLKDNAMLILLVLAHNILHLLSPHQRCAGETLADCPAFTIHELSSAAVEIGFNFNLDPKFGLKPLEIAQAMIGITEGIDRERLRFHTLLQDIQIDL
jgi:hypothetical protein